MVATGSSINIRHIFNNWLISPTGKVILLSPFENNQGFQNRLNKRSSRSSFSLLSLDAGIVNPEGVKVSVKCNSRF